MVDPWHDDEEVERAMLSPDCPECGARWAGGDPRSEAMSYKRGSPRPSVPHEYRCGDCGHYFTWPAREM